MPGDDRCGTDEDVPPSIGIVDRRCHVVHSAHVPWSTCRCQAKGEEIFSQGNDAGQLCALPENFWEDDEDPRTEKGEDRVVDGVSYNVLHLEKYCWPFWILEPASSSDPYYIL